MECDTCHIHRTMCVKMYFISFLFRNEFSRNYVYFFLYNFTAFFPDYMYERAILKRTLIMKLMFQFELLC